MHPSVDGHLGRFHVLAIVNSAAVNIRVHVSFLFFFFCFVSQVSLTQSNQCAKVECFGVSCPECHQEHRLPGVSPSSCGEQKSGN